MTHQQIERLLNQDLDDLKVRNPQRYQELEKQLRLLQLKASLAVSASPIGLKRMEKLK